MDWKEIGQSADMRRRRIPFASTENTSRCDLSVPDEPEAVYTRATGRIPLANGTRVG